MPLVYYCEHCLVKLEFDEEGQLIRCLEHPFGGIEAVEESDGV